MVAGCPKCSARYRVDVDRIGPDGAKLRCTKCSAVFLVRAPKAVAQAAAPVAAPVERPRDGVTSAGSAPETTASTPTPVVVVDRARLVILADPDEERGKVSAEAIQSWGLIPHLVHDGVEAMLAIQRMLPAAVVLDAALPKMFGFQVCEVVKRNESLQNTRVVLVGAIHHQSRYRRAPTDLYGADVYLEQPDLPDGLLPILRDAGLPVIRRDGTEAVERRASDPSGMPGSSHPVAPVSAPPPRQAPARIAATPAPTSAERAPAPKPDLAFAPQAPFANQPAAAEDPERTEERERARRLARIAVSEMVLYQPEKFEKAAKAGSLEQVLDLEIQEARALLRQRISEEVRAETDFIIDELNRVAAERSGRG